MFRKVLKYDFRAVGRLWWILALSLTWISVLGAIALRSIISFMSMDMARYTILTEVMLIGAIIFLFAAFIAICASGLLSQLLVYYRFYRNFYTDEGYLTFTLPVSRKTLLLSKTVNAFIWTVLSGALIILCLSIFILIAPPAEYAAGFYDSFFRVFLWGGISFFWDKLGAWLIVYVIEGILILSAYTLFSISLIHFCITTGAIVAKKYKLLAGIGIYYVANMAVSIAWQIIMLFGSAIFGGLYDEFLRNASSAVQNGYTALVLLITFVGVSALALVAYLLTQKKLERKLNLE